MQVLHLGGNLLEFVPDELGELPHLNALVLCDNLLKNLPRAISHLTRLRSLLLHRNRLHCLPVEIVKLRGLTEVCFTLENCSFSILFISHRLQQHWSHWL